MAGSNERIYRSLRGLEKTASTSRVLNLAALAVNNAGNPEHSAAPLFKSAILNGSVVLKHRLRQDEVELFEGLQRTATKIIVPFDKSDLSLGGRTVFVGEKGWMPVLQELRGGSEEMIRDVEILEAVNVLPSHERDGASHAPVLRLVATGGSTGARCGVGEVHVVSRAARAVATHEWPRSSAFGAGRS